MATAARQKAVLTLLKPPAVQYVRTVKKSLERDPRYLESHQVDVGNIITGFLAGAGFHWHQKIFERDWPGILQEALDRLPSKKR